MMDKSSWQPIETAPRDRTPILVYLANSHLGSRIQVAVLHKNVSLVGGNFSFDAPKMTHWQPLPEPPDPAK